MNIGEIIKNLDFDIQQIDTSIDLLNYIIKSDFPSPNGRDVISNHLSKLWDVQHHLLSLRADLLRHYKQNNADKTLWKL